MSTTHTPAQPPVVEDQVLDAVQGLTALPADHAESAEEV